MGAPHYLSYILDKDRHQLYLDNTQNGLCQLKSYNLNNNKIENTAIWEGEQKKTEASGPEDLVFSITFDSEYYDLVMVFSDGVQSFQKPVETETSKFFQDIPAFEIINHITSLKGTNGRFIARRCKRFLKECAKQGWQHNDDFSVAAVHLE